VIATEVIVSTLVELQQLHDGPIPPAALAIARFGSPEMVALIRAGGEAAFFRSMVLRQLKTIRMRRADGTGYPALLADLQLYRQQFRSWNGVAAEMRRVIRERDSRRWPISKVSATPINKSGTVNDLAKGASMNPQLHHSLAEHEYLRQRLKAEFPDADEDTLRDTLEGLSNLPEMLACALRSYLDDIALTAALGTRINDMQERITRFEKRAEKKRALITSVMERADLKKLAEPDFTVSVRMTPPSLTVTDETEIPQDFWKPQPPKLDRQGLTAALRRGQSVPGAVLGNGQATISVRTR
jgi:hypothetical protein